MRRSIGVVLACLLVSGVGGLAVVAPANAGTTGNSSPHPGRIVSDNPSGFTPNVMDGQVETLAQVGNMIIVGGTFTTVRNAGSSTNITRRNVFAFNATTGQVSTSFAPNPNGTVYKALPAADGTSVYVGGSFTSITSAEKPVIRVPVATVSLVRRLTDTFVPPEVMLVKLPPR